MARRGVWGRVGGVGGGGGGGGSRFKSGNFCIVSKNVVKKRFTFLNCVKNIEHNKNKISIEE